MVKYSFPQAVARKIQRAWGLTLPPILRLPNKGPVSIGRGGAFYAERTTIFHAGAQYGAYSYSRSELPCRCGNYVSIAPDVTFAPLQHPLTTLTTHPLANPEEASTAAKGVVLENDVWIGEGALIMNGVTIGNGAVVGSRAVVTKDVPPYAIVGGVPAKIIRYRFPQPVIDELVALEWWKYDIAPLRQQLAWNDIHQTIAQLKAALAAGTLRPFDESAFYTREFLEPFAKRRLFYFEHSARGTFVKCFGVWIFLRLNKKENPRI